MIDTEVNWEAMLASEGFKRLARRRRATILTLGALAAIYYFSIPALIAWAPGLFRIRLTSGINLGTLFAVSQYPFGGLIAYFFLRQTMRIDQASTNIKERAAPVVDAGEQSHAF